MNEKEKYVRICNVLVLSFILNNKHDNKVFLNAIMNNYYQI